MQAAILLVLLTLNPAGQTGVNFVETDDMDTCQGKTLLLRNILTSGGIKVLENRCLTSPLKFSKYNHRPAAANKAKPPKRHAYRVVIGKDALKVTPMPDLSACETAPKADPAGGKVYCATSTQIMTGPGGAGTKAQ